MYIHKRNEWPNFLWDSDKLIKALADVRNVQGRLIGKLEALGFNNLSDAVLETLTLDVIKSTEIEGEVLSREQVRSSLARRLGIDLPDDVHSSRNVDGVVDGIVDGIVELTLDATQNFNSELTEDRLFGWHCALFPTGRSGLYKIVAGNWRDGSSGPMQVVSGSAGREKVHFEAPDANEIPQMMHEFISWYNNINDIDDILKAGIAHLYFVTLHPFEDGNGRITRALTDMLLARSDGIPQRFYSMSAQIMNQRKEYYDMLEKTQKGTLEITSWLIWFLDCLLGAIKNADVLLEKVVNKYRFWQKAKEQNLNERQQKIVNMLLDDFKGKLNTSKWAKITKCSTDTALRDIQDLVKKGLLIKGPEGGRSTSYLLAGLE